MQVASSEESLFSHNEVFRNRELGNTLSPDQVKAEAYDLIYYTGGHGTMWDFPDRKSENNYGIYVDDVLIGDMSRYWENKETRWLEIGIVIYDENYWSGGYGTNALRQWITKTFNDYPEIEHIGLTTWSGNIRMMKAAEKLGMLQEARIRKVRYWQGEYHDSVKYGILRDEWNFSK